MLLKLSFGQNQAHDRVSTVCMRVLFVVVLSHNIQRNNFDILEITVAFESKKYQATYDQCTQAVLLKSGKFYATLGQI